MNREELKKRLAEIGVGDNRYSLNGELIADRIVLYPNYSKWEVFYFSERGTREHYQVFPSEEQACQCIFDMIKDELCLLNKIEHERQTRLSCNNS